MTVAIVLRAYLDTSSEAETGGGRVRPGYYSPLHPRLGCATLIPIPEPVAKPLPHLDPRSAPDPCTGRSIAHYQPLGLEWLLHRDPRLGPGFYTDYWAPRGRIPHALRGGGLILFAAGLTVYPEGFWERRRTLGEIRREHRRAWREGRTGIYLVAVLAAERVVDVAATGWDAAVKAVPALRLSPHYARTLAGAADEPAALIGQGFLVKPPLPLGRPGQASVEAKRLLGAEEAEATARGNWRRSRVLRLSLGEVRERLSEMGHTLEKAPHEA